MKDICENKHKGNSESVAAYKGNNREQQRERVLEEIKLSGEHGLTCDELALKWECDCNAISGRFSELKMLGRIKRAGTRLTRSGNNAGVYAFAEAAA